MLPDRKSGSGGLPERSFSPASFSAVRAPEILPAVNLNLDNNFQMTFQSISKFKIMIFQDSHILNFIFKSQN